MKKIAYLLIPVLLVVIIFASLFKIFILDDAGKGALQVTSKPFSKVYLNNNYIGTTPLCRCEVQSMIESGTYTLRLVPLEKDIPSYEEQVKINKGVLSVVDRKMDSSIYSEGSVINLELLPDKKTTELLVITFPDNAEVFVDANAEGNSPLHMKQLTDSDHTIRIKKNGYKDKTVRIRTPIGYKLTARVYLSLQKDTADLTPSQTIIPTTTINPTPTGQKQTVRILQTPNGFLRVRAEPTLNGAEIGRVETGQTFHMLEEQDGWYKISLTDGITGWISAQYASKLATSN